MRNRRGPFSFMREFGYDILGRARYVYGRNWKGELNGKAEER